MVPVGLQRLPKPILLCKVYQNAFVLPRLIDLHFDHFFTFSHKFQQQIPKRETYAILAVILLETNFLLVAILSSYKLPPWRLSPMLNCPVPIRFR